MPLAVDPVDSLRPASSSKHSPSMPPSSPKKDGAEPLASPSQMMMTGSMVRLHAFPSPPFGSPPHHAAPHSGLHQRMPKFHEFQCPLCPRSYAQKCSLYRHMKVHKNDKINESEVQQVPCTTGEGQFKCPFCIASYTNAASLNVHVRTHAVGYRDMVRKPDPRRDGEERLFPCPLCSRVFQRRSRLTVHLNISHRHEAHKAVPLIPGGDDDEADSDNEDVSMATDAVDLSRSAHESPSPSAKAPSTLGAFACHLCGSSYTRRTNLNKHLEKRHHIDQSMMSKSAVAEFEFMQKKSLEEEMRAKVLSHQEDAMHSCPFCPYKTVHRFSLYQHMTTFHATKEMLMKSDDESRDTKNGDKDEQPGDGQEGTGGAQGHGEIFPCTFCSRVYLRKCNLTQHMKMHFQEDADLRKRQTDVQQAPPMQQFCNDVEDEVDEVRRIIELTRAMDEDSGSSSVHECAICGVTFSIRGNLLMHLQMHEKRALEKKKEKQRSSLDQVPPLIRPPPLPGMTPQDAFVMTQDTDGKTTIQNQQAYMLSHLQVLNQVQRMLMYGRQPPMTPTSTAASAGMPKKRPSIGSVDEESQPQKRPRPGPKSAGRHWKLQDCDPNRRPVLKCSICPFEISDSNQEGLLQHMASMHGVRCKLCPEAKFHAKKAFEEHCAQEHSSMCQANEMEQLMVFGEIVDSGYKMELVDSNDGDGASTKSADEDGSRLSNAGSPLSAFNGDDRLSPSMDGDRLDYKAGVSNSPDYGMNESNGSGSSVRQVCPKCGLHYAQKSSLNRHIRTHHNYSRVEEMMKAESIHSPSKKELQMPALLPPGALLPPHLLGLPNHPAIPAQGLMADMNQLLPRSLFPFGAFPPPGSLQESKEKMMHKFLNNDAPPPEAFFRAIRQTDEDDEEEEGRRSSAEDDEVSAINLSINHAKQQFPKEEEEDPEDLSMKKGLDAIAPEVSPPQAKGRSRRKPQVVQRIVRNHDYEDEERKEQQMAAAEAAGFSDTDSLENEYGPQTGFDTKVSAN